MPSSRAVLDLSHLNARASFAVPARCPGATLSAAAVQGAWATATVRVRRAGAAGFVDLATPRTLTPAAPTLALTEAELAGVDEIECSGGAAEAGVLLALEVSFA